MAKFETLQELERLEIGQIYYPRAELDAEGTEKAIWQAIRGARSSLTQRIEELIRQSQEAAQLAMQHAKRARVLVEQAAELVRELAGTQRDDRARGATREPGSDDSR